MYLHRPTILYLLILSAATSTGLAGAQKNNGQNKPTAPIITSLKKVYPPLAAGVSLGLLGMAWLEGMKNGNFQETSNDKVNF